MSRKACWTVLAFLVLVVVGPHTQSPGLPSTRNGDWPHYTADMKGNRYSPLDQINASNFNQLEVAWRFKTDNLGPRPEYKLEGTPVAIKGVLYTTGGTRRSVIALDGKTGEVIWTHSLREGRRAAVSPRQLSGRGVSYWTDGKGDDRVVYVTTGFQLVELNAKTGALMPAFGKGGILDLKVGAVKGKGEPIDLETGEIGVHSTPAIVKDVVIVGSAMREGATVSTHNNTKGLVRAFDVRSGKLLWTFNTIPRPGEFGNDTWEKESWAVNGNTGVWTQITADEDLGLVYLPVETPTSDFYGGHRPGNNLFAESLVCVDLKTGQRKWHYQLVHHPIWNFDNSSAPLLLDINVAGKPIKAVALPSKLGWLYVFDRVTGQPVWPIEERPVPQSDVPGEKLSATQPFPTKPPAYARNYLKVPDDLIDFTPELRAQALERLKRYKYEPSPFAPPILGNAAGPLYGALVASTATNWPGSGADPETHVVYAQAGNMAVGARSLVAPPKGFSDIGYVSGIAGQEFREVLGPGDCCAADAPQRPQQAAPPPPPAAAPGDGPQAGLTVQGLPMVKPPYGTLAAINLDRGDLMWQVPHGDTPDNIRTHPLLAGKTIPKTGQPGTSGVGLMVTKTLVVMGDPQITAPPGRQRGAMLRAYDKQTGREVGAVWMPAPQSGSPMTYSVDGKQYIIVAVGGGAYLGEYLAFALPRRRGAAVDRAVGNLEVGIKNSLNVPYRALLTAIAFASISLVPVAGQDRRATPSKSAAPKISTPWTLPRTSWGDPALQGIWNYATMTPLERPRELAGKAILTEDEAAAYEKQVLDRQAVTNNTAGPDWWDPGTRRLMNRRTSLIVDPPDGRIPPQTKETQARVTARAEARRNRGIGEGPEDLALNERCLLWATAGPPMLPGVYNNNVQFLQFRGYVVILNEMIHDARIVPLDGRPHGSVRRWMGDPRGRWDGNTLVVDTINFTDKTGFRGSGEGLHLVERFTRVRDDTIEYQFTADDPATWTTSWTASISMTKTEGPIYEYACHDGNYKSIEGILRGARVQEKGR